MACIMCNRTEKFVKPCAYCGEKGPLKSCIVHNCDADRCGCSLEVSQADFRREELTSPELPSIARIAGEAPMEGPVTVVWETTRKFGEFGPFWSFQTKAVEVRSATEVRKIA